MKITIAFFLLLPLSIKCQQKVKRNLYSTEDNIQILNSNNFKNVIESSTKGWLIEFYANWCGYCIKFASKWKKIAAEIVDWQDLVALGAVDCSEDINVVICRKYEVVKFPTVLYFHENENIFNRNNIVKLQGDYSSRADKLKNNIINILIEEQQQGRGQQYPNLQITTKEDLLDFSDFSLYKKIKFIFLITNKEEEYLGNELALDLHKTPNISIRQAQSRVQHNTSLIVYDLKNNKTIIFENNLNSKVEIRKIIESYVELKNVSLKDDLTSEENVTLEPTDIDFRKYFKAKDDVVFREDLDTALLYSLQREVATHINITDEALQALHRYLILIKKYLFISSNYKNLINDLLNITSSADEISGDYIYKMVGNATLSTSFQFIGCLGSSENYRGYPCTVWQLFHYFTVNAAINKQNYNLNSLEVLLGMQGYIKYFFSCQHCSEHFQEMIIQLKMWQVSTMNEAILWLWRAHNIVNSRLRGDITEDPVFPKYQFPAKLSCEKCYKNDNSWNIDEVINYLVWMYDDSHLKYLDTVEN